MRKSEGTVLLPTHVKADGKHLLAMVCDLGSQTDLHRVLDEAHKMYTVAHAMGISLISALQEDVHVAYVEIESDPDGVHSEDMEFLHLWATDEYEEVNYRQNVIPSTFPWALYAHLMGVPIAVYQCPATKSLAITEVFQSPDGEMKCELTTRLREALNRMGVSYKGNTNRAICTKYSFLDGFTDVSDTYYTEGRALIGQWYGLMFQLFTIDSAKSVVHALLSILTGYSPQLVQKLTDALPAHGVIDQFHSMSELGSDIPKLLGELSRHTDQDCYSTVMTLESHCTRLGDQIRSAHCVHSELTDGDVMRDWVATETVSCGAVYESLLLSSKALNENSSV